MSAPRIPVTVLTGFLGSGKTTVLNRLLRQPELDGTVAIINEFGAVGLDHLLVETSEERFALLDNGCICCTVRDDLVATLKDIVARSDAGTLPAVKRILIETTGLADPVPVLHTLIVDPDLAPLFAIDGVTVTVDAVNGLSTLERHPEAMKQVAVADRVLITKADIADAKEFMRLERRLARLAPTADRFAVAHGAVEAEKILGAGGFNPDGLSADVAIWFREAARAADAAAAHDHDHHDHDAACADPHCGHDHHHHPAAHDGIQSYAFVIDQPVEWAAFAQWLEYLTIMKGEKLLRMKGLVHLADDPSRPMVVHAVQSVVHPPARLAAWPDDDRRTRIVFIVRDIPRETVERTLARFASIEAGSISRAARQEELA